MEVEPNSSTETAFGGLYGSMSPEEYRDTYWAMLREAIDQMLANPPGTYKPISYEQMYSAVYKCVCKQYSEQLYSDLMAHMTGRLHELSGHLGGVGDGQLIHEFHKALLQYFHAMAGIVPIFTYMNRFYVEAKLNTDLRTELVRAFAKIVCDPHVKKLLSLMCEAQSNPFSVPPIVMSAICKHLNVVNRPYVMLQPELFALYLPDVLPPMKEEDLQAQQARDRELQERLLAAGWQHSDQSSTRKRDMDDCSG